MSVMRSVFSSVTIVALASTVASACSDSSGGDSGGSGGGCKAAATDICEKLQSCFPFLIQLSYGDVATCVARSELSCNQELGAPGSNVDNAALSACAAGYRGASCDDLLVKPPDGCDVPGTRNDGEPCQFGSQCSSQNCRITTGACGTCAPRSAAGGQCVDSACEEGLVCANGVCASPVAAGGACTVPEQCAGNLTCKAGTCAEPSTAGQACTAHEDCDFFSSLYCDPQSQTCKTAQVAAAGESCGLVNGTLVICAAAGSCNGATATTPGTCAAAAADGAACNPPPDGTGPSCLEPAECISGSCQLPNADSCT